MSVFIQPGNRLPPLHLNYRGLPTELIPGRSGQVLYFMRTANCPVCLAHVRRLAILSADLSRAGFSIAAIVPASASNLESEVVRTTGASFPVLVGSGSHELVGLRRIFFSLLQQSGTVITDSTGAVLSITRSSMPQGAFPESELRARIRSAQ